jgi:hypothetical protein
MLKTSNVMKTFWYILHNCVAHPLLPFLGKYADRFHDWTAKKMIDSEKNEYKT